MALFPTDAKDGEIFAADNGKNYVYQEEKNVWQSTDCVPKWSDQVFIRGVENETQQNVNDTNQEVNVKVGNVAAATNQLLDVAFDVRCRGVWIYQGGAVAPGDPPVGLQRFLMTDAEGIKTQIYSDAVSLTIHAMGAGQMDKVSIGETEVGDLITIQNTRDLGGGSYIVTAIEEFGSDNPAELTDTYAVYTVTPDVKRCSGNVATEEKAVIRIIPQQAVPAFEDSEYLKTNQSNDVTTGFRIKSGNNTLVSTSGNKLGLYNLSTPTNASHAVNLGYLEDNYPTKQYLDEQIAAIPEPEIPEVERLYTFRNIGATASLHQKRITYSTAHGGQLTIPYKPLSGPSIGNGDTYFGFKSWTGQFSLVVETEPGTWRTILLGVTSEIRCSTTGTTPFWEVKIPAAGLIVNTPSTEYNDLNCKLQMAGLF